MSALRHGVAERDPGKVFKQIAQQGIWEPILVGPLSVAENAVERLGIGLFDSAHGLLECRGRRCL